MQNFVYTGHTIPVTAPVTVKAGQGVLVGNIFGVAYNDTTSGSQVQIQTTGVLDIAKDTSTFADGDKVFWDNTALKATSLAGANRHIGAAQLSQPSGTNALGGASGDATVRVRLNWSPSASTTIQVARAMYSFAVDGGAVGAITPVTSDTIPANALVVGGVVNSSTAVTSGGSATVSVGTTAGSSATSILAATAKTSLSIDAVIVSVATTAPFKMSASGQINMTVAVAALTAGIVEVFVYYIEATNA